MPINRACDATNEEMEWDGVGPDLSHEDFDTSIVEDDFCRGCLERFPTSYAVEAHERICPHFNDIND